MGEILLGIFIESLVNQAFSTHTAKNSPSPDEIALFSGLYLDCDDNPENQAVRLRLSDWLSPLTTPLAANYNGILQPVLTVHDAYEKAPGPDASSVFRRPISIELGFQYDETRAVKGEKVTKLRYATLSQMLERECLKRIRFDAMRTAARLSNFCPELGELLETKSSEKSLSMKVVAPLLFNEMRGIPRSSERGWIARRALARLLLILDVAFDDFSRRSITN